MDKVNELIKHEIAREIVWRFPNEIISVTAAEVSRDLSFAKVWLSTIADIETTVRKCQSEAAEIRQVLASKLTLKKVPKITFYADRSSSRAEHIESLIDKIHKEEKE